MNDSFLKKFVDIETYVKMFKICTLKMVQKLIITPSMNAIRGDIVEVQWWR